MNAFDSFNQDIKTKRYILDLTQGFQSSIDDLKQSIKPADLSPLSALADAIRNQHINIQPLYDGLAAQIQQYATVTKLMHHSIEILNDSVTKLKLLLTEEEKKALQQDILISYSDTSLPSGSTNIDFREGLVTKSDDTKANLSSNIQEYMSEYVRSVTIMTSVAVVATLAGKKSSLIYLPANKYVRILNHEIHRITIDASTAFDLWLSASMEQDGAVQVT